MGLWDSIKRWLGGSPKTEEPPLPPAAPEPQLTPDPLVEHPSAESAPSAPEEPSEPPSGWTGDDDPRSAD